jgi:hypothetical protein
MKQLRILITHALTLYSRLTTIHLNLLPSIVRLIILQTQANGYYGKVQKEDSHYQNTLITFFIDPFYSFLSPQYEGFDLQEHYSKIAKTLQPLSQKAHLPLNARLKFPALIASVLSLKCHLREELQAAYKTGDKQALYDLARTKLQKLCTETDALWRYHRNLFSFFFNSIFCLIDSCVGDMWLKMNKPFGLEVLEIRYGGLRTRLTSMYERIMAYVNAAEMEESTTQLALDSIPELEADLQCAYQNMGPNIVIDYQRAATPCRSI